MMASLKDRLMVPALLRHRRPRLGLGHFLTLLHLRRLPNPCLASIEQEEAIKLPGMYLQEMLGRRCKIG